MSLRINNSQVDLNRDISRINKFDNNQKSNKINTKYQQTTKYKRLREVNSKELFNFLSDVEKNIMKEMFGKYKKEVQNISIQKFQNVQNKNSAHKFVGNKLNLLVK